MMEIRETLHPAVPVGLFDGIAAAGFTADSGNGYRRGKAEPAVPGASAVEEGG